MLSEMSTRAARQYEVAVQSRTGHERVHRYESVDPLEPGQVLRLEGRYWLVERVDAGEPDRAEARPARYRIRLRHPDGREEPGSFRRYRSDAPRLGHTFTTLEDGQPISWGVAEGGLAYDPEGDPYLDLVAERDYAELEEGELPDHELEHALAGGAGRLPEAAAATLSQAEGAGLQSELVALEPGEAPDWDEAQRYIEALVLEEIEDDLFELCGVNVRRDPRETWLSTVQERLRADLDSFRSDIEGDHDEIEEWDFLDGSVFAAVGTFDEEANPNNGFGWLCRLVDAGVLAAAGFRRVRKPELQVSE
jgi:hypothetical protein